MKISARRIQPIREGVERPQVMGITPAREELRTFLLEASRHRFGPVGLEGVVIPYTAYDVYKPRGWVAAETLVQRYGHMARLSTAWPKLVADVTGLRVATRGESQQAAKVWAKSMDVPLEDDEIAPPPSERSGLPAELAWRDVRAWDCRAHRYVVVGRQSVWSLR